VCAFALPNFFDPTPLFLKGCFFGGSIDAEGFGDRRATLRLGDLLGQNGQKRTRNHTETNAETAADKADKQNLTGAIIEVNIEPT
jgi:hypothetical protein